ncbi:MAG: T9SS type A sorting domain-containing protein [Bacteroidales bacterium]|nr:T9SS type A sorting domain-containing protein [Bacteroidales bacterium]
MSKIEDNKAPVAIINTSDLSGTAPFLVSFDASSTHDDNGDGFSCLWQLPADSVKTGEKIIYKFRNPGTFSINLIVTDIGGLSDTASVDVVVEVPSGFNTINDLSGFGIYPNPAKNLVTIEYQSNSTDEFTIEIFGLTGQLIKSIPIKGSPVHLSLEGISEGIYYINMKTKK